MVVQLKTSGPSPLAAASAAALSSTRLADKCRKGDFMRLVLIISIACFIVAPDRAESQSVRGAFPSPSVQILPMLLAQDKGFYKREGLDLELVFVGGASTAVQALLANQIHFIFSVGPQMPAVWEGNDIMLLAQ